MSFWHHRQPMVSLWSLSDSKSPHVSKIFLSILADLNDAVVYMVSTRTLISKSSTPFNNHLVTVPRAPITIGITVTFIFLVFFFFFNSLVRSRNSSFLSFSFNFSQWSAGTAKSAIWQVLNFFFFFFFGWLLLDLLFPRLGNLFESQNPKISIIIILLFYFFLSFSYQR